MSIEMTQANLKKYNITMAKDDSIIHHHSWSRDGDIKVKLWIACQHPLTMEMSSSLLPFMDACCIWYHDKSALSCIKVREGIRCLSSTNDNIWLMATSVPFVRIKHLSRIERCYDSNGFERPFLYSSLDNSIEKILETEISLQKKLYSF